MKNKKYFDQSRKKKVGLYTDELPLVAKELPIKQIGVDKEGRLSTVDNVRHKGFPHKSKVKKEDYSSLILLWENNTMLNVR